jgi:broad specificity phosphatase PhoE
MKRVALIRHGLTAWNEAGRIQGHRDLPLSAQGILQVREWRVPKILVGARCYASPLLRARQTAHELGFTNCTIAPEIIEMDWGEWEGQTLRDLRDRNSESMRANEARGLDLRAPGGESPREVRERLYRFVEDIADSGERSLLVTHKGVIRAAVSLATGWDLKDKPDTKIRDNCAHLFEVQGGIWQVDRLNVPLDES